MNRVAVKRRNDVSTDIGAMSHDDGFSIVEVIMTIVLMGIVLLPLMDAAIAAVKSSSSARRVAELQTVLLNAADRVNRAPVKCTGYLIYVEAAAQTKGWPPEQATATYEWYQPGATAAIAGTWQPGACNGPTPTLNLVQRVTITITSPEADVSRTMQVVKSDV